MSHWLVQQLVITSGLSFLVALISRVVRLRPAIRHMLWLLVLIKFLMPPVLMWPWNPIDRFLPAGPSTASTEAALPSSAAAAQPGFLPPSLLRFTGHTPTPAAVPAPRWGRHFQAQVSWLLVGLWILGGLSLFGLQLIRMRRCHRLACSATPAPEWLEPLMVDLAGRIGINAPRIVSSERVNSVITWTVGPYRVIVPQTLLETMAPGGWGVILAHELAHLKRRDHWSGWIELAAGCMWWWNPVFWYARARLHESAEMACDAWVVWALPERRREYAETLVRVVEFASHRRAPIPALGMGSGPAVAFERRLVMILRQRVPRNVPMFASVLLMLLAVAVLPGWTQEAPATGKPATSDSPPSAAQEAASGPATAAPQDQPPSIDILLNRPVSLMFEDIHLSEITRFLGDSTGLNIVIDWRAVQWKPRAGLPTAQPPATPPPSPDCVTDGIVHAIDIRDVTVREALTAVLRLLNLTFTVDPAAVWISSPALIAADAKRPAPDLSGVSETMATLMHKPMSIEFQSIHVQSVLHFIQATWDINIVLDARVVPSEKATKDEIPSGSTGYVTDGIVHDIKVMSVSMMDGLRLLLRPLNLTFTVDGSIIWVSSYDLAGAGPVQTPK